VPELRGARRAARGARRAAQAEARQQGLIPDFAKAA